MQSLDKVAENIRNVEALFPNAVTEQKFGGAIRKVVDFDVLRQELSDCIVEGPEERYQFTWPDKRKSILAANAPINKTLRPCREESVNFDTTENLYIEGDNLEVLKLLQETYLGKVKMIYIDPPYNTGNDFIYKDDFKEKAEDYLANSGQYDEDGNQMVQNTESNGRFHTNWLNRIYPVLKLAKDLLSDDGGIFISIDDHEQCNLKKICDEIFGGANFLVQFVRKGNGGKQDSKYYAINHEYILCYARNKSNFVSGKQVKDDDNYPYFDAVQNRYYKTQLLRKWGDNSKRSDRPNLYYPIKDPDGDDHYPMLSDTEEGCWRWGKNTMRTNISLGLVEFKKKKDKWVAYEKIFQPVGDEINTKLYTTLLDGVLNNTGAAMVSNLFGSKIFDYPKPVDLLARCIQLIKLSSDDIVLDFFSGSATTAHAVMQLNAEDGGKRKFIMVQLPELTDEKSEAYKAGYKNICEIGKERIRRAGKKILEEHPDAKDLDIGFRVLKCDSSNMEDVYYTPADYMKKEISLFVDNVKTDRSAEDLLFQCMLELDTPLSSSIEVQEIGGKAVYNVAGGHLMACFDTDVTDEVVTEIAKLQPSYFVLRDSSMADDSVAANFEQIFKTYSPHTERRVL